MAPSSRLRGWLNMKKLLSSRSLYPKRHIVRWSVLSIASIAFLGALVVGSEKQGLPTFRELKQVVRLTDDWKTTCRRAVELAPQYRCWVSVQGQDAATGEAISGRFQLCVARENSLIVLRDNKRIEIVDSRAKSSVPLHQNLVLADSVQLVPETPLHLRAVNWAVNDASLRQLCDAVSTGLTQLADTEENSPSGQWAVSDIRVSGRVKGHLEKQDLNLVAPIRPEGRYLVFEGASLVDLMTVEGHIQSGQLKLMLPAEISSTESGAGAADAMLP